MCHKFDAEIPHFALIGWNNQVTRLLFFGRHCELSVDRAWHFHVMASRTSTPSKGASLWCTSTQASRDVSFFSFPVKNADSLTARMNAVETRPGFKPRKYTYWYLCERHFDEADHVTGIEVSRLHQEAFMASLASPVRMERYCSCSCVHQQQTFCSTPL